MSLCEVQIQWRRDLQFPLEEAGTKQTDVLTALLLETGMSVGCPCLCLEASFEIPVDTSDFPSSWEIGRRKVAMARASFPQFMIWMGEGAGCYWSPER